MLKRPLVIFAGLLLLVAILWLSDPLNYFAFRISYVRLTNPMWMNGFFGTVDLPASASPQDIVQKCLERHKTGISFFDDRHKIAISEPRRIWVLYATGKCYAASVTEDGRPETLLMEFRPGPNPFHPSVVGYWHVINYTQLP